MCSQYPQLALLSSDE